MSESEAAKVFVTLFPYANNSMVSWLVIVGCVVIILLYAAWQCERERKR